MTAALFNQIVDPRVARAVSAGTQPAAQVYPVVVDAIRETTPGCFETMRVPLLAGRSLESADH